MMGFEKGVLRISQRRDEPEQGGGGVRFPKRPLFELGQIVITATALETLDTDDVQQALKRHISGEWGDLCAEDRQSNEDALRDGTRLFSAYTDRQKIKFYIITEWDRSVTTVLLPQDY